MTIRLLLLFIVCGGLHHAEAAQIRAKLYLNHGQMITVTGDSFPYYVFNSTALFSQENSRFEITTEDELVLTVYNRDSKTHGFGIKGQVIQHIIGPYDSLEISLSFKDEGCYVFEDYLDQGRFSSMGAAGMIAVSDPNDNAASFYWNIKEHQSGFNAALDTGGTVNWSAYYPDYFTINGKSNPDINLDTAARVTGAVGDTIHIYIANTGRAIHSLHFHGYHFSIKFSSKYPGRIGRSKDTFGVFPGETVVLLLVPDKTGEFPVHDHNLVAVSGGGLYPNGMFTTLLIQ